MLNRTEINSISEILKHLDYSFESNIIRIILSALRDEWLL